MANGIKLGNLDISAFKVGSADTKVYLGDTLLYPTAPPSFQGKWLATYSDSSTTSAECDSTSSITQNEITLTDLVSVEIGDCVTSIGTYTFYYCTSLTSCTIGSGVTSIGNSAFYYCYSLTRLNSDVDGVFNIPNSVTSIGQYAFGGCRSLTSITCLATTPPTLGDDIFYNTNNCPIYVPAASVSAYQTAWSDYASRIFAIPNS